MKKKVWLFLSLFVFLSAASLIFYSKIKQKSEIAASSNVSSCPNFSCFKARSSTHNRIMRWSDPNTWGGKIPQEGAHIIIPENRVVLMDVNPPRLGSLQIHGTLTTAPIDIALDVGTLVLKGTFRIGSLHKPYKNKALIRITKKQNSEASKVLSGLVYHGGYFDFHGIPGEDFKKDRLPAQVDLFKRTFSNIKLEKL